LWQELQEKTPDADMRGSKKSAFPRSIFSGVTGFAFNAGIVEGSGAKSSSASFRRSLAKAALPEASAKAVVDVKKKCLMLIQASTR
jgi:hypothetical protein